MHGVIFNTEDQPILNHNNWEAAAFAMSEKSDIVHVLGS